MPVSTVTYTANGSNNQFSITFPYIDAAHVRISVDGSSASFTFHNSTTAQLNSTPTSGQTVVVYRQTPSTALVDFTDGSTLFESDLDLANTQARYISEEARDRADIAAALVTVNNVNINVVAGIADNVTAVAENNATITTVAGDTAEIVAVASKLSEISSLATTENFANMSALGTIASDITAVANVASTMSAAAQNAVDAAASATLAGTHAASAATALDDFDDKYLGVFTFAATPAVDNDGDPLETGALFYDSTNSVMKVWEGSSWISAAASASASFIEYRFVATEGQTSFTGADANGATLGFIVNNCSVTLNGVKLSIGTDFTTPSGMVVTLIEAASLNDILVVEAFSSFAVSDAFLKSAGGTINGPLEVNGVLTTGNVLVKKVGRETIWVPASAMYPLLMGGCAPLAHVQMNATLNYRPEIVTLDFDDTTTETAQFSVSLPKSWDLQKTIKCRVYWSSTNLTTNGCTWGLRAVTVSDGSNLYYGMPDSILITDSNNPLTQHPAYTTIGQELNISGISSNINITGTPTLESLLYFNIHRIPMNGSDTLSGDARLHGIKLYYDTNAGNDE